MSHLEIAKASQAHFMTGNIEAFLGTLAEDCEWTSPEDSLFPGVFRGRNDILNKFLLTVAEAGEFTMTVSDNSEVGDEIFVRGTYTLKHRESGKTSAVPFVQVTTWKNGQMTKFCDFYDTHMGQLSAQA